MINTIDTKGKYIAFIKVHQRKQTREDIDYVERWTWPIVQIRNIDSRQITSRDQRNQGNKVFFFVFVCFFEYRHASRKVSTVILNDIVHLHGIQYEQ